MSLYSSAFTRRSLYSSWRAKSLGLSTARLPIAENLNHARNSRGTVVRVPLHPLPPGRRSISAYRLSPPLDLGFKSTRHSSLHRNEKGWA